MTARTFSRRWAAIAISAAVVAAWLPTAAQAQAQPDASSSGWPQKPLRAIVPTAAGSAPDAIARRLAGNALLTADGLPGLVPHIRSGRLRALGGTSAQRLPGFDEVPAVAETYPGFEAIGWFQLLVPTGTPRAVRWPSV